MLPCAARQGPRRRRRGVRWTRTSSLSLFVSTAHFQSGETLLDLFETPLHFGCCGAAENRLAVDRLPKLANRASGARRALSCRSSSARSSRRRARIRLSGSAIPRLDLGDAPFELPQPLVEPDLLIALGYERPDLRHVEVCRVEGREIEGARQLHGLLMLLRTDPQFGLERLDFGSKLVRDLIRHRNLSPCLFRPPPSRPPRPPAASRGGGRRRRPGRRGSWCRSGTRSRRGRRGRAPA